MRTTLTIDDDLAHRLRATAARERKSFKEAVNQALRRGLASPHRRKSGPRIKLKVRGLKYRKGVDEVRIKDLLDEADIEDRTKS